MKYLHTLKSSKTALVVRVTGFSESFLFPYSIVCLTLLYKECWSLMEVKWPRCGADHPPSSSADDVNCWICPSMSPLCLHTQVMGDIYLYCVIINRNHKDKYANLLLNSMTFCSECPYRKYRAEVHEWTAGGWNKSLFGVVHERKFMTFTSRAHYKDVVKKVLISIVKNERSNMTAIL